MDVTARRIGKQDGRAIGWCLGLLDLLLAKLPAGRPHDLEFVKAALAAELAAVDELARGIELMPERVRADVRIRLGGLAAQVAREAGDEP